MRMSIDTAMQRCEVTKVVPSKFPQRATTVGDVFECMSPHLTCAGIVAQQKRSRHEGCRHKGRAHVWGRWRDVSSSSGGTALFPNVSLASVGSGEGRQGKGDELIMARLLKYLLGLPSCSPTFPQLVRPPEIRRRRERVAYIHH